jgi:TnpA family transposase
VPVDFLSAAQIASYGRYGEAPSARQLERFFHFDDRDRERIAGRRGDHNRLGFAVQLATVRFLGTFLARPADVPPVVARTLARELAVDPDQLASYARRGQTHREHAGEIQRVYGYRDFSDRGAQAELMVWLHARAWTTAERPSVLFDLATARLIEAKVLLPGASVLARLIAAARDQATERLYATLAGALTADQRKQLRALLDVIPGELLSGLERLRSGPRKLTATELLEALLRLQAVHDVGVGGIVVDVPAGRERALARYGLVAKAQTLRRMSARRRDATLLAALWQLELDATDDALILLDVVVDQLLSQAAREHKDQRFKTLPELDRAARRLRAAVLVLLDPPSGGLDALWAAIGARVSREDLEAASDSVGRLTPAELDSGGQDAAFRAELLRRYPSLRRFLPALLDVVSFEATAAGRPVLDALNALRGIEGRPGRVSAASVPLELVGGQWKRLVLENPQLGNGELDRRAYSFCVLEALQQALDRRDVFVPRSGRYTDPRASLLSGPAWEAARPEICASLNHHPDPKRALDRLAAELDGAYRQTAGRLDANVAVEIETIAGMDRPDLSALEALDEPAPLSELRADVDGLLPNRVAFSEILLEVCRWTDFADAFTHLSEGRARVKELHISICAVLFAEACNISLEDVAHPGIPALSYARLAWVSQNYVRAETIAAANELLLKVHARIPLVGALGDGHIATVDGMRFRVPVRSIYTGPNPRYFDTGRGVTWLNYMTDQFAGLHAIVVPGTLRDSLITLDGLLELDPPGAGGPTMIITDQASYSDQVFGLYWLLGYQFSPRPAGLPDQRFWRLDRNADYGPLDRLARNRINTKLITRHWDDILRVVGSLSTGTVRASELLRVLQGGGRPTPLGRAIAELGRAAKTLHLLSYLDSDTYRRTIGVHLNRHEGRHSVARVIFHGNRGELRQPYREGQEDQLAALGFALNVLVLWNTQYMDDAVNHVRASGREINDEHLARLSPLQLDHVLMLGTFPFTLPHELAGGRRRALRTD